MFRSVTSFYCWIFNWPVWLEELEQLVFTSIYELKSEMRIFPISDLVGEEASEIQRPCDASWVLELT